MTGWSKLIDSWNDIPCRFGNHTWGEYACDSYGFYHILHTRRCKHCGKIEGSLTPFKHNTLIEVKDAKIFDSEVR